MKNSLDYMAETDETLKQLKEKKALGDNSFGQKDYSTAIDYYLNIIKELKECFESRNLSEEEATRFIEVIGIPTHLNICRAFFKQSNFAEVVKYSSKIIELDQRNLKALYIRCRSYITLQEIELAEEDLKRIRSLDGVESEIKELSEMLERKRKEKEAREKAVYKKMIHSGESLSEHDDNKPKSFKETIVLLLFEIWSLVSIRLIQPFAKLAEINLNLLTSFYAYTKDLFFGLLTFSLAAVKYILTLPWKFFCDIICWIKDLIANFGGKDGQKA